MSHDVNSEREVKIIELENIAALTTHELEWLEPWGKLAELELTCSNRELVYFGNTYVTQSTYSLSDSSLAITFATFL